MCVCRKLGQRAKARVRDQWSVVKRENVVEIASVVATLPAALTLNPSETAVWWGIAAPSMPPFPSRPSPFSLFISFSLLSFHLHHVLPYIAVVGEGCAVRNCL